MGSLRLPSDQVQRLRRVADRAGLTLPELIRRTLAGPLEAPRSLASPVAPTGKGTMRIGLLRLSPEVAERLSVVAAELGVSTAEVVRRALTART